MDQTTKSPNNTSSCPVQPPSWRYDLANQAVASGRVLFASQADKTTRQLVQFLSKERSCTNEAERDRHRHRHPGKSTALGMHRDRSKERACWLESLVLARESTKYIAQRCDVSPRVVQWYRVAFFSVGAHLDDINYILSYAIMPELEIGSDDNQTRRHFAMKLLAYFCGTHVLEQCFLMGRTSIREHWRTPNTLISQLCSMADIAIIADLVHGSNMFKQCRPEHLQKWRDHVLELVNQLANTPQPRNIMERTVGRMNISPGSL